MHWDSTSHYEILQVSQSAPLEVIRASYRVLVQKYHPDRHTPRQEAERITKRLNEAYAALSDPELRAAHDEFLRDRRQERSPPEPPPEQATSAPKQASPSPPDDPGKMGAWGWIGMVCLLHFSGYVGVGLMGGGVIPYLLGVAGGGVAFNGARMLWRQWNSAGRVALVLAWAAVCFCGMIFNMMLKNERTRLASNPVADATSASRSATNAPQPIAAATQSDAEKADSYLQLHNDALSDEQFAIATRRWLERHPEANSDEGRDAMSTLLGEVYAQYPRIALGAALDMALARGQKYAADAEAQSAARTGATAAGHRRVDNAAQGFARAESESYARMMANRGPPQQLRQQQQKGPAYPTQAEIYDRLRRDRQEVEDASKGNIPGAYKRYDYQSGQTIWFDAQGNKLE